MRRRPCCRGVGSCVGPWRLVDWLERAQQRVMKSKRFNLVVIPVCACPIYSSVFYARTVPVSVRCTQYPYALIGQANSRWTATIDRPVAPNGIPRSLNGTIPFQSTLKTLLSRQSTCESIRSHTTAPKRSRRISLISAPFCGKQCTPAGHSCTTMKHICFPGMFAVLHFMCDPWGALRIPLGTGLMARTSRYI